jgi:hypothetical protein
MSRLHFCSQVDTISPEMCHTQIATQTGVSAIKTGILATLVVATFRIIQPFIVPSVLLVTSSIDNVQEPAATLKKFVPQLQAAGGIMLGKPGGGVKAVFMFITSVALAEALPAIAENK